MIEDRLKEILEFFVINQTEFADSLGITQSSVSRYLSGDRDLPMTTVLAIKAVYNINPNWLLTGEGPMFIVKE